MRSRGSIYDLLSPRPVQPSRKTPETFRFHTDGLRVENAWLLCGSGDIHSIIPEGPRLFCDFDHDHRLRDDRGHYVGISRVKHREAAALDPRARATQLIEQSLKLLMVMQRDRRWQDSRVVLQAPAGVAEEDWLNEVLVRWPIDRQPTHGIEITALPLDAWLTEELSRETGKTERLQFIAVAPLSVPAVSSSTPPGEVVACLWLRRAWKDAPHQNALCMDDAPADAVDAEHAGLRLMSPLWTLHEPRHEMPRGSSRLLEAVTECLGDDTRTVKAIVWDGDRSGMRFDHLISTLQQRFSHLFLDTDLWSVQGVAGALQHASTAVQAVLATHLARQRQGDVLLLDSRDETRTLTLLLHHEAVSRPVASG